jgi:hypothetical protein
MMTDEKRKGPASYFPSIEKKYGRPIEHWLEIARGLRALPHMVVVDRLKAEHGLGHGHANAVVASVLAESRKAGGAGPTPTS